MTREQMITTLVLLGWEPVRWKQSGAARYLINQGRRGADGFVYTVWITPGRARVEWGWVKPGSVDPAAWTRYGERELEALWGKVQEARA